MHDAPQLGSKTVNFTLKDFANENSSVFKNSEICFKIA